MDFSEDFLVHLLHDFISAFVDRFREHIKVDGIRVAGVAYSDKPNMLFGGKFAMCQPPL